MTVPLPIATQPKSFPRLPSAPPLIRVAQTSTSEPPTLLTFSKERFGQTPISDETISSSPTYLTGNFIPKGNF